jgi:hypothetical protein
MRLQEAVEGVRLCIGQAMHEFDIDIGIMVALETTK